MAPRTSLFLLLTAAAIAATYADGVDYYRAAVVNYQVVKNNTDARQNLMTNVRSYELFLKEAQTQQADIIVFPEEGLFGDDYSIFLPIPDPALKLVPNASYDESLQMLSGFAKKYNLYLAVNVRENFTDPSTKKVFKYNTNIVFDNSGALIARYRKYNIYGEQVNRPEKPDYSTFTAFNVTFGQFTCFDIQFKEPALTLVSKYNVTDFIYPSQWYSELPFLTSIQTQWSWAVGNNVNLLSAGRADVKEGHTGSGIFRGKNALHNLYSFSDDLGSTMLTGDVYKNRNKTAIGSGKGDATYEIFEGNGSLPLMQQPNMDQFVHENITLPSNETTTQFKRNICHNKLCCNFDLTVQYPNAPSVQYKAVVFDGKRTFGGTGKEEFGLQVCGVVLCTNGSITSCGPPAASGMFPHYNTSRTNVTFTAISINGNFISDDANPLPNVLLWPSNVNDPKITGSFLLSPSKLNFNSNKTMSSLSVNNPNEIINVAIHSRVFSRDPGNGASLANTSILTMIMSVLPLLIRYT